MPMPSVPRQQLIALFRSPGSRGIVGEIGRLGGPFLQYRGVKRPGRLYSIAMGKEGCITKHRIEQETLVSVRGGCSERSSIIKVHYDGAHRHIRIWDLCTKAQGDPLVRLNSHADQIWLQLSA